MPSTKKQTLGEVLHATREALGLTLRQVEEKTGNRIKNGYLSQIENGDIQRPSPETLWQLAETYGLDYADLLLRAGHRVPKTAVPAGDRIMQGIPLSALQDLDDEDRGQLLDYIAFLRSKKKRQSEHGRQPTRRSKRP